MNPTRIAAVHALMTDGPVSRRDIETKAGISSIHFNSHMSKWIEKGWITETTGIKGRSHDKRFGPGPVAPPIVVEHKVKPRDELVKLTKAIAEYIAVHGRATLEQVGEITGLSGDELTDVCGRLTRGHWMSSTKIGNTSVFVLGNRCVGKYGRPVERKGEGGSLATVIDTLYTLDEPFLSTQQIARLIGVEEALAKAMCVQWTSEGWMCVIGSNCYGIGGRTARARRDAAISRQASL